MCTRHSYFPQFSLRICMAGDPIRKLPPFHVLGMTVKMEYVRRDNMKSGICRDVDNDVTKVALNWTRILLRKQWFIQRAHAMVINSFVLFPVGYNLVTIQELVRVWWLAVIKTDEIDVWIRSYSLSSFFASFLPSVFWVAIMFVSIIIGVYKGQQCFSRAPEVLL